MLFVDRADAGRQLARRLLHLRGTDAVVIGLPRGGVPAAAEVARELRAPLDVIVVRKLGVPFQPEYGFGAIGEGGARIIDDRVVRQARLTAQGIASVEAREAARRLGQLRDGWPPVPLAGRTTMVVDDGIATGSTARAACLVARARGASRVIVAVPVGAAEAVASLRRDADEVICLHTAGVLRRDRRLVRGLLPGRRRGGHRACSARRLTSAGPARRRAGPGGGHGGRRTASRLPGSLVIPPDARGLVVFAHGSGSSRHSPRNQFVAAGLNRAGLGTLLVDLLTPDEELSRANVFNVALLAARLTAITRWLRDQPGTAAVPVGYFGASTGTAAALAAATATPRLPVTAIVSRGGRPDLVGGRLALVQAPTLLIVGGADKVVLDLNQRAHDAAEVREPARRRSRRHPPVLRARSPRPGDRPGRRLVRPPLRLGGHHRVPRPEGTTFGLPEPDQRPCPFAHRGRCWSRGSYRQGDEDEDRQGRHVHASDVGERDRVVPGDSRQAPRVPGQRVSGPRRGRQGDRCRLRGGPAGQGGRAGRARRHLGIAGRSRAPRRAGQGGAASPRPT